MHLKNIKTGISCFSIYPNLVNLILKPTGRVLLDYSVLPLRIIAFNLVHLAIYLAFYESPALKMVFRCYTVPCDLLSFLGYRFPKCRLGPALAVFEYAGAIRETLSFLCGHCY